MPNQSKKTENSAIRPPIVVILGHVDHGKTTILDKIRQTKIAEKEAGGITQHIGAYQIEIGNPPSPTSFAKATEGQEATEGQRKITFLDTPGHEAFNAIRSRGANVADIAILVIAAEEGVKPQTKEAIQIIKEAKLPFIVAINKIDKEGSNPSRVRQELAEQEVLVEDYGGTIPVIELSAKSGNGINELLEMILLVAELEELTAKLEAPAEGTVIESRMDSRRGLVATLVVQDGRLNIGDWVSAGRALGRAKALYDFHGKVIQVAIASQPCQMLGWEQAPSVGQKFKVVPSRQEAEKNSTLEINLGSSSVFIKETGPQNTEKKIANLIIKADVQSSLEAIDFALKSIHSEEVDYNVIGYGVGNINDADIKSAKASHATVVGFHVEVEDSVKQMAEREKIRVETFDIIYQLVEIVRSILSDMLEPEIKRIPLGKMKILAIFKDTGKSQIIGGKVTQGKAVRGAMIDVIRNGSPLITGKLGQLQHDKADVAEVSEGMEAGIRFDAPTETKPQNIIKEGDVLEIYQEEKIKRSV